MNSLKVRLLVSSFLVFILFMGFSGIVLERAFVAKTKSSISTRLLNEIYELLRLANLDRSGALNFPGKLSDESLMQPKSGYYAAVAHKNKIAWYSISNLGIKIPYKKELKPGERVFTTVTAEDGSEVFLLSMGYLWSKEKETPILYTFNYAESAKHYQLELSAFRHGLWTWVLIILFFLSIVHALTLTWGLKPLSKMKKDLAAIEDGRRDYLDTNYIEEIKELTTDLNTLLRIERARQERYKNALGDLAHSFKTPLAVINSTIASDDELKQKTKNTLKEQVNTLTDLVTYQLRRAQAAGTKSGLNKPVNIEENLNKILLALKKVYQSKKIKLSKEIDSKAVFYGNVGDLLEIFGNLLDNAYKWCKNKIKITVTQVRDANGVVLTLSVEDNGRGISDEEKYHILKRGVRADEQTPGHGIGMSILNDIVNAYSGKLEVTDSVMGGAKFIITINH